jgi:hypothetical protein
VNPELIIAAMLNQTGITALVGNRRALGQLPQNSVFPAIVYQVIDGQPQPSLNYPVDDLAMARIQINPLAVTLAEVKNIHAAVRAAIDFKHHQTFAGKKVMSCRFDSLGPIDRDEEMGIWTQSADYMLRWYE